MPVHAYAYYVDAYVACFSDLFALSIVLPCAYVYVASKNQAIRRNGQL